MARGRNGSSSATSRRGAAGIQGPSIARSPRSTVTCPGRLEALPMHARWIALLVVTGCADNQEITVTARFSATPVRGVAPLLVQFTDESIGDVGGWDWDF